MFKHGLIAMMMVLAASAARAVTIQWTVPCVTDDFLATANSQIYLLSSTGDVTSWTGDLVSSRWDGGAALESNTSLTQVRQVGTSVDYAGGEVFAGSGGYNATDIFLDVGPLSDGTYYALVFVSESADTYAVTKTYRYTPAVNNVGSNGYADVDIDGVPTYADFLSADWLFTNYVGTPEPTVFALLALGVAGLSLRRRTR